MKNLLMTTALVAFTAVPLHAGTSTDTTAQNSADMAIDLQGNQFNLSQLLGARVYIDTPSAETEDATADVTEPRESWEDIGEIGEAYFSDAGDINSVIVDVGGFLGMGERHVEVTPQDITILPDADDEGQFFVVYNGAREDLEGKEEYDFDTATSEGLISAREQMAGVPAETALATASNAEDDTDYTKSSTDNAVAEKDDPAPKTDFGEDITTLTATDIDALKAEDLQGLAVYDAKSEHVGEISELILTDDGKVSKVIVDVGGFLGIGEKPVAMSFEDLDILKHKDDADLAAKVSVTMEELEAMEAWDG